MATTNPTTDLPPSPPETIKDPSSSSSRTSSLIGPAYPLPTHHDSLPPISVLPEDAKTPDAHVPRDPRLIRLTGTHPFNVEPPLSALWRDGFLTSNNLHYVRNHGAVPNIAPSPSHSSDADDSSHLDWEITIEGLVETPLTLTLRELLTFDENVTYPVTLVCAGNRRKEQNVVRKTKGFSWGAAGVSTALWTGVPLAALLARAKPLTTTGRAQRPRYVCFEGADQLPNGVYGTSIPLAWASDPQRGVLVAHGMNGAPLPPDHGRPLRVVVPGLIGGRSVKWLKRIVVTAAPSDNWYHIYDNRVLPTTISPEASANLPETWRDERYAIYELNVNSAVAVPAHDERVAVKTTTTTNTKSSYTVQGYAYAGGGRRVTRVEVTLDRGASWRLAEVTYPEDAYRDADEMLFGGRLDFGLRETSFCWCFWAVDIAMPDLVECNDIMVRAMDDAMSVQPRDMYWSVLGMMNNPWYRVVVHREDDDDTLRFEHPTQPALMAGGWMERVKKEGGDLLNGFWGEMSSSNSAGDHNNTKKIVEVVQEVVMTRADVKREIDIDELRTHAREDNETEPWFVLHGEVYDGTAFLEAHPGGAASIVGAAGVDVSEEFMAIHSENAKAMMPTYHIGTLTAAAAKALLHDDSSAADTASSVPSETFLHPKQWQKAHLASKKAVSVDTTLFTFTLPSATQRMGLPVGQHILMRLRDPASREVLIRAYTPYSEDHSTEGRMEVLVKIYPDGAMTTALDSLPLGHWVEFKGPVGRFVYLENSGGQCTVAGHVRRVRRFVMICGGSGVTPIFAVLRAVLRDERGSVECVVVDGNRTEDDILCREELEALSARCRIVHTLSKPGDGWTGRKGRIDQALLEEVVGSCSGGGGGDDDEMALICGPPAMEESVRSILLGMGWSADNLLFF